MIVDNKNYDSMADEEAETYGGVLHGVPLANAEKEAAALHGVAGRLANVIERLIAQTYKLQIPLRNLHCAESPDSPPPESATCEH